MSEHLYDFGHGELYRHELLRAEEVVNAKKAPGLYAWYVRPPKSEASELACAPYRQVFAQRDFKVKAAAPLSEFLEGSLTRRLHHPRKAKDGEALDEDFFAAAFAAFAPPVYIGRSKDIRGRLRQHYEALKHSIGRDLLVELDESAPPDSDEESSQFGLRLGALLRDQGLNDLRGVFVKIVYANDVIAPKRAELILNRTFHPVLGRL